jgi:XTP/dITP diphosphohydrolase
MSDAPEMKPMTDKIGGLHLPQGAKIVAATHNPGKAKELAVLLEGRFEVVSAAALNLPEPEETETTFVGNAILKARAAADRSGLIALADDSGLSVRALGGQPGIYSARWAGPGKDFTLAMDKVRQRLEEETDMDDLSAWFSCALAVAWPGTQDNGGPVVAVEGRVDGTLTFPARGTRGFGYDPIFIPQGGGHTFGEMDPEAKDAISHRARAFAKLKAALFA